MSKIEVVMPQLGESLTEGTIVKWHKKPGDKVRKDETLLEISTDKVDSEIPSPAGGVVTKLIFPEQKTVAVRTVIAEIETDESSAVISPSPSEPSVKDPAEKPAPSPPQVVPVQMHTQAQSSVMGRFYSPLVLNIAREEGISMAELERVPGTGDGGRVSKKDILGYIELRKKGAVSQVDESRRSAAPAAQPPLPLTPRIETNLKHIEVGDLVKKYPPPQYEILQMSNLLMKMSEHMVRSVQTSPHVQAIHECDMSGVDAVRRRNAGSFEKKEGFKLTFMPFICDAVIRALKQFPLVNSIVDGDKIILKKFINLGIAVASENGLIVPVIKNSDEKSFIGLARAINDVATRARTKHLTPSDIEGGTFTITNFGVFGTMLGIPIINQPQVAILGTGAITKRPVIINDAIAIRSIGYFTLSFDHRIVDGALGGSFMDAIVKNLQNIDLNQVM